LRPQGPGVWVGDRVVRVERRGEGGEGGGGTQAA